MENFFKKDSLLHGHSYSAHPIGVCIHSIYVKGCPATWTLKHLAPYRNIQTNTYIHT